MCQTVITTMKTYGLILADNGSNWFFQGTEDYTTPTALARQYLGAIKAPHKEFVPIDGGHFAVFMNSDQFLRELVAHVLPLATSSIYDRVAFASWNRRNRTAKMPCGENGDEDGCQH